MTFALLALRLGLLVNSPQLGFQCAIVWTMAWEHTDVEFTNIEFCALVRRRLFPESKVWPEGFTEHDSHPKGLPKEQQ
jgi:hypothetical protein